MSSDDLLDPASSGSGGGYYQKQLPNATATLVLGICSIVGCFLYGLPGLICGVIALVLHQKDKRLYDSDRSAYEMSYKNAKAGYICAIIGTSLSALYFVIAIIVLMTAFTGFSRI